jgi:hypothetical protein
VRPVLLAMKLMFLTPVAASQIAFTQSMVQTLQQNLCIDTQRIYAAGKSEGGGFVSSATFEGLESALNQLSDQLARMHSLDCLAVCCYRPRLCCAVLWNSSSIRMSDQQGHAHDQLPWYG